jgi:hypothetical protein
MGAAKTAAKPAAEFRNAFTVEIPSRDRQGRSFAHYPENSGP